MFYAGRTWQARRIHAFEGVLPLSVDFGRGEYKQVSLCGRMFAFGRGSLPQNEKYFRLSPCKKCWEKWQAIQIAEIFAKDET